MADEKKTEEKKTEEKKTEEKKADTSSSDAMQQAIYTQLVALNKRSEDIKSLLNNVVELEVARMPEIFRNYAVAVTGALTQIRDISVYNLPWISFIIVNDGPNSVYVDINERRKNQSPIKINESMRYSTGSSNIYTVYLQCNTGNTANVRIYVEAKRYPNPTAIDMSQ